MEMYQKMYHILFNAITDSLKELEEVPPSPEGVCRARLLLQEAQRQTEELYISQKDPKP